MDENNKGTVIARKSTRYIPYQVLFTILMLFFAYFFTFIAITENHLFLLGFTALFLFCASYLVWWLLQTCLRPDVAIRDFGNKFTVYYAFGKTRTFEYTDIDDFMAVRCVAISMRNSIVQSYGNLVIRVKKRKYLTGIIGDVESVRRTLNMIRPYKQKK